MDKKKQEHDHEPLHAPMIMGYAESYVKMSKARSIFLSENITKKVGTELSALLLYYDHIDHEEPISIYIHTNGGDSDGLSNIYDVMQMIRAPIKTILLGKCYSAGAFILAAGTKGERYALPSAKVMIHGVQFGFPIPGQSTIENSNYFGFVEQTNDTLMKILAKHTGHTLVNMKKFCEREMWMSSLEAVRFGLIDWIFEN